MYLAKKEIQQTERCNDVAATCPQVWPIVLMAVNIHKLALHVLPICGYTYIHRWAHSKCYFTRTHRKRKVTFPQMRTAQMGQSRSSSPSVQYSSQLLKYMQKSEQTIWITLISGLRHSSLFSSFPQISWVSLATPTRTYKNLRFVAPLLLMVFGFLLITHTYIHSTFTLPSLNNSLQWVVQIFAIADLQVPLSFWELFWIWSLQQLTLTSVSSLFH